MYTLGIPKRDYRRTTQVLSYESEPSIPYHETLQDDGFYMFTFPEVGCEDDFRDVVIKLKSEGIRVIGADAQLTERQIMKLIDLVPINEGTCGYSIDGKPADKPAGPHLLRKAIRREIRDNFDDRLKSFMGADDFEKATNPKLSRLINNAITSIDPNMSYRDFAKGVAQVLKDQYNRMNQNDFIRVLRKELDI